MNKIDSIYVFVPNDKIGTDQNRTMEQAQIEYNRTIKSILEQIESTQLKNQIGKKKHEESHIPDYILVKLDEMTIKEFNTFKHYLDKYSEEKISKYFRELFLYVAVSGGLSEDNLNDIKKYLEYCYFSDGTYLSKCLDISDPLHDFTVSYHEVEIVPLDSHRKFKMTGDPINYHVGPMFWSLLQNNHRDKPPENVVQLAIFHWTAYRAYIDSKPDDDRDLSPSEEDEFKLSESRDSD